MDRSDVFVSYRRTDIAFVRELDRALREAGLEVWVDWEDILPASPSYLSDIHHGIDGADAIIAVFSPDYFQSPHCMNELLYASDNHKRIVPLVYDKGFDEASVPDSIRMINRVFFCPHIDEQNDFDTAFPRLMAGINLDHDYVREHTNLMVRARRWHDNQRDPGYLLAGKEIDEAGAWLIKSAVTQPAPNKQQIEFIEASRQAENERHEQETARREHEYTLEKRARARQRNFLLVLIGGLTLAIGLLIFWANNAESSSIRLAEQNLVTLLWLGRAEVDRPEFHDLMNQIIAAQREPDSALWDLHLADLDRLTAIDQDAFFSSVVSVPATGEVIFVAGRNTWGETLTLPPDHPFWISSNEPQIIREAISGDDESQWVTGWIDIPDPQGNVFASVILEVNADDYFQVESNLTTALGFIFLIYVGVILFYLWQFIRYIFKRLRTRYAATSAGV